MADVTTVVDAVDRSRFEWVIDGHVAVVTYRRDGQTLWLDHAGVPAALGGRGLGSQLVERVPHIVRQRGERVVPVCSFIAAYIARHPEHTDLLARD
jgi:uncharacterized protein